MEAVNSTFKGDLYVSNSAYILLRVAAATQPGSVVSGRVYMDQGTTISYSTSGTGFKFNAPIILTGDITLSTTSSSTTGSIMDLPGTFSGSSKIKIVNPGRSAIANIGTVALGGDNSNFTGTWDLTTAAGISGGSAQINGTVENAFGKGLISLGATNKALFNNAKSAGDALNINIVGSATAVLNVTVLVKSFILNGITQPDGTYNASTNPGVLTGTGSIVVTSATLAVDNSVVFVNGFLKLKGSLEKVDIYNFAGKKLKQSGSKNQTDLNWLPTGYYIVHYQINGKPGSIKIYKK